MAGIYKITNKLNGRSYIGKASDLELRKKQHFEALQHSNKSWYPEARKESNSIDDFTFEVLQYCEEKELDAIEEYWVKKFDTYNNGYNKTEDGQFKATENNKIIFFSNLITQIEENCVYAAAKNLNGNDFKLFIFLYLKNINREKYTLNKKDFDEKINFGKNGFSIALKNLEKKGYLKREGNLLFFNYDPII